MAGDEALLNDNLVSLLRMLAQQLNFEATRGTSMTDLKCGYIATNNPFLFFYLHL